MYLIRKMMICCLCFLMSTPVSAARFIDRFNMENLPNSRAKERIKKLRQHAQNRAIDRLNRFSIPRQDLGNIEVDENGDLLYIDDVKLTQPEATEPSPETSLSGPEVFALHSNPGAPNVIYLDFDGHEITGTIWNSSVSTYFALPFDRDGSPASFSQSEINDIAAIWHRVAEDYSAFNVDVTTEAPLYFNANTGRILITKNLDETGQSMPYSGAGGVAYVGVWGSGSYPSYQPALVYYNNLGGGAPKFVAEAASHEMGHNQGLGHDGTSTQAYYGGHGDGYTRWAPIMGNAYNEHVTQWSKGDYNDANNTQDDISIIANNLGFKPDDHGDEVSTASFLYFDSIGNVVTTNPESDPDNLSPDNKGTISTRNDVDVFEFTAGPGLIDLTVTPSWAAYTDNNARGANLDIRIALLDAAGQEVAADSPADNTSATIQYDSSAGTYFLAITGVGSDNSSSVYSDYGSEGTYYISGVIPIMEDQNAMPIANDDTATISEDSQITLTVLNNDNDPDGDPLTITSLSGAALGQNSTNGTSIFYQADPNASGTDSFSYTISDGNGGTASATITITINPVNDAPVANNDVLSIDQDTAGNVAVLANDTDIDGDNLSIASVGTPSHGDASISSGMITYIPDTGYAGNDSFTYIVEDGRGGSDTGSVNVTVNQDSGGGTATEAIVDNSVPGATSSTGTWQPSGGANPYGEGSIYTNTNGNSFTWHPDLAGTYDVSAWWTYYNNRDTSVIYEIHHVNGVTEVEVNQRDNSLDSQWNTLGNFTLDPSSFVRVVHDGGSSTTTSVDALRFAPGTPAENTPPVAAMDTAVTSEDTAIIVAVLANDSDTDNDPLTVASITQAANGDVAINGDNTVTYAPNAGYFGADSFTYVIEDGRGGFDTGTVNITVNEDTGGGTQTEVIVDNGDSVKTSSTGSWKTSSGANPYGASSVYSNVNGNSFTWSPDLNAAGAYKIAAWWTYFSNRNTSVTYEIHHVNGATEVEVNQRDNSLDSQWNTLGSFMLDPSSFVRVVHDGGSSSTTSVDALRFTPDTPAGNTPPVAAMDTAVTSEDTAIIVAVLANDSDTDNDPLTVASITQAANGDVTINGDNTVTYAPNAGYFGADSFTYVIEDGRGGFDTGTVNITVNEDTGGGTQTEVIVDNGDSVKTSSTGSWKTSSGANPYDASSVYSDANGNSFTWNPNIEAAGNYGVAAWWTWYSNRDTSVTYEVHHVNGVTNVVVNQRDGSLDSQWNSLGDFTMDHASFVRVIHNGGSSSTTNADALRFSPR